jgi:hypothetical protein
MAYTDRRISLRTVVKKDVHSSGSISITDDTGWSYGCPSDVAALLDVGTEFWMETKGFNTTSGFLVYGTWYHHTPDEEFAAERERFVADLLRREREALEENRDLWQAQEAALPEWLRDRLLTFHEKGGEKFELEGWGYELIVCRLAALYADSNLEENEAINRLAEIEGTSGNQHEVAKAIAKAHLLQPERSMADTVSALTPITGNPFYEGES